jgi:inner membrane protein involved in colicin E2 resistance
MRARWAAYAFELAALVGVYVLIAVAFGWIFAVVLGVSVAVAMGLTWRLKRKRDSSLPPPT